VEATKGLRQLHDALRDVAALLVDEKDQKKKPEEWAFPAIHCAPDDSVVLAVDQLASKTAAHVTSMHCQRLCQVSVRPLQV
jgi:hypothetical protein